MGALASCWWTAAQAPSYTIQTIAGSSFTGDNGPAARAVLTTVEGIAADAVGNLYLADADQHRIRKISPAGIITTVAGTGRPGFSGDDGPAAQAQLQNPYGLALDGGGNLYVADLGNARVRRISPAGVITTVAGHNEATRLQAPRNVTVDSRGLLYVSDFGANRVLRLAGETLVPVTAVAVRAPAGLVVDRDNHVVVCESGQRRVVRIAPSGVVTPLVNVTGLSAPTGLARNAVGDLFIADGTQMVKVPAAGPLVPVVQPARDVTVGPAGQVYLAQGGVVRQWFQAAVTVVAGGAATNGDGGPATGARLSRPAGVAWNTAGELLIADSGAGRLRRVGSDGVITTVLEGLSQPSGIFWHRPSNSLYFAEPGSHRVRVMRADGTVTLVAGDGTRGNSADGIAGRLAQLNGPSAVVVDAPGTAYILDDGNSVVRSVSNNLVRSFAQVDRPAAIGLDEQGRLLVLDRQSLRRYPAVGAPERLADGGTWVRPRALVAGADGEIYIVDEGANRVTARWPDGRVTLVAGTGVEDFAGDGGPAAEAALRAPAALAFDAVSHQWAVADTGNDRIRLLTPGAAQSVVPPPVVETGPVVVQAATRVSAPLTPGGLYALLSPVPAQAPEILINGQAAPLLNVAASEVLFQVPELAAGVAQADFLLSLGDRVLGRRVMPVADSAPGLFAAVVNEDGTRNGPEAPAGRGSYVSVYGTGQGRFAGVPTVRLASRDQLSAYDCEVVYFGPAPGMRGVFQLNFRVPTGFYAGGSLALRVELGGARAQDGLTVTVR